MGSLSPDRRESRWMGSMSQRVAMLALTARNVSTEKENLAFSILTHFASRLDSLAFLLKEMQRDAEVRCADYGRLQRGKQIEVEVETMEAVCETYNGKSNLYLLSSCPHIAKEIQICSNRLAQALDAVLQNAGCTAMRLRIVQVKEAFETGSPKLDARQQAILDSLEPEMLDSVVADPARSTKLVQHIAESLEITVDSEHFAKELKKLKKDKESIENSKGKMHGLFLDQFEELVEKVVSVKRNYKPVVDPVSKIVHSPIREVTTRSTPLTPLQSFICPITRDVMRDPVQIASGMTYERTAIERWFTEGHTRCPMGVDLKNTKMKSNIALRQSIAEWRERNFAIRIQNAGEKLMSDNTADLEHAVQELKSICEEDNMNKYAITSKGLLIPLIRLAEKQKFELRKATFAALLTLAEDNDENQDIMVSEGIIDMVVRCLARRYDESEQAILLLRLLSARPTSAERISHSHGAVLLLVTLLGSDREETTSSVKVILENLPTSDDNIIIMAEANLMKPLVMRLVEGNNASKVRMAKTLAGLQMPEASKIQAATEESVAVLMAMTQSCNEDEKEAGISALDCLSKVRHVCSMLAKETFGPEVTFAPELLAPLITSMKTTNAVKIGAARVIANIMTCLGHQWEPAEKRDNQVDWLVCTFLQWLNPFAPPPVQANVLRGLVGVSNGEDTCRYARLLMKEQGAFSSLVQFLKQDMDPEVRKSALQLFASLSASYGEEAALALKDQNNGISNIVELVKASRIEPEHVAGVTILANLPVDDTYVTTALIQASCIPLLVKFLKSKHSGMEEAAAGALLRFTSPELREMQLRLAAEGMGVVQKYVSLLDSVSSLTKERAARALLNFSKSSLKLTKPVEPRSCFACFSPAVNLCPVHCGECKVESNFCLKEADAVGCLVAVLKEGQPGPCEAALEALMTLVDDELDSEEPGCQLIAKAKGVPLIINLLNNGTVGTRQVALVLLEKIFRSQQLRLEFGAQAQMHIITVAQQGSSQSKQAAGKILRQLDLLHSQSHYFGNTQSTYDNPTF